MAVEPAVTPTDVATLVAMSIQHVHVITPVVIPSGVETCSCCCAYENAAARCYSHYYDRANTKSSLVGLAHVVASSTDTAWSRAFAGPVQRSFVVRMFMATPYGLRG